MVSIIPINNDMIKAELGIISDIKITYRNVGKLFQCAVTHGHLELVKHIHKCIQTDGYVGKRIGKPAEIDYMEMFMIAEHYQYRDLMKFLYRTCGISDIIIDLYIEMRTRWEHYETHFILAEIDNSIANIFLTNICSGRGDIKIIKRLLELGADDLAWSAKMCQANANMDGFDLLLEHASLTRNGKELEEINKLME